MDEGRMGGGMEWMDGYMNEERMDRGMKKWMEGG